MVVKEPGFLGLRKQNSLLPLRFQSLHAQFWPLWFVCPQVDPSAQEVHALSSNLPRESGMLLGIWMSALFTRAFICAEHSVSVMLGLLR